MIASEVSFDLAHVFSFWALDDLFAVVKMENCIVLWPFNEIF